ncbi:MAG: hypothetical protein PVH91_17030, partial [Pseudomonadales bacterium]
YAPGKVLFYLQLLLFSGLAFFLLLPLMRRTRTISLDTDWLWRVLAARAVAHLLSRLAGLGRRLSDLAGTLRGRALPPLERLLGGSGALGRTWQVGTTALWIVVLLTAYVSLYYL